ncbi:hypothetical protein Hdeb2414_s0003g00103561 [Helianthus debilis subsp. tardiflorus]
MANAISVYLLSKLLVLNNYKRSYKSFKADAIPSFLSFATLGFFICSFFFFYFNNNNNKVLPRFNYYNSQSPLPFPIDLSPITHVKALPD